MNAENRNKTNVQTWTADWLSILVTDGSLTTNPQLFWLMTKLCLLVTHIYKAIIHENPKEESLKVKDSFSKICFLLFSTLWITSEIYYFSQ